MNTSADIVKADLRGNQDTVDCHPIIAHGKADRWYARYVLAVLFLVYVFNFLDRQILSILAEDIKADLGISDSQLGFLFGTAFAVFYATFGIALGRLADIWNRKQLIAVGLGFWSLMTALSGLARGFLPLAFCRFGVGVGESSASPAAYSILYDYFPPKVRTTVLGIYGCGVYIGAGLGLFLGGWTLDFWSNTWPEASLAPFGLKGWQASFMIVGLPGLLVALWVASLREPVRGAIDGIVHVSHPHPFREAAIVLVGMLPVGNLWILRKEGGWRAIALNLVISLVITLVAWWLIHLTGDILQWSALGVGVYAAVSWTQGLAARDPVVFGMIFKCKTLICIIFAAGPVVFMAVALPFWAVPYFQRYHGVSATEIGTVLGWGIAVMGFFGMLMGGMLADVLRRYSRKGKLYVWSGGMAASILSALLFLTAEGVLVGYVGIFLLFFTGALSSSPFLSTINDLVLPRGRATTSAFSLMITTFVGVALGPYAIGLTSDAIATTGVSSGEALRQAMLWSLLIAVAGLIPVVYALKHIEADEDSLLDRAKALGEDI